jgi:hypothetical protein
VWLQNDSLVGPRRRGLPVGHVEPLLVLHELLLSEAVHWRRHRYLPLELNVPLRPRDLGLVFRRRLSGLDGKQPHLLLERELGAVRLFCPLRPLLLLLPQQAFLTGVSKLGKIKLQC